MQRYHEILSNHLKGVQWLSGRVLDSRPMGCTFEPHLHHCVLSLSKNINPSLVLVQPRKTRLFITARLLMGRRDSNQTNKSNFKLKVTFKQHVNTHFCSLTMRQTTMCRGIFARIYASVNHEILSNHLKGAQWLRGRVTH